MVPWHGACKTGETWYNASESVVGTVSYGFNDLEQQTSSSQGQVVPLVADSAAFPNLPQTRGQARTFTVCVQATSERENDLDGNQVSLTDPESNTTSWTYDFRGEQVWQSEVVALGYGDTTTATSSDQYDASGNVTESVDADGQAITYAYSFLGQETGQTWYPTAADASAGTGSDGSLAFGYNVDGQMTSASNAAAGYTWQYDSAGDQTAANVQLGSLSTNVVLSSAYNVEGRRTSLAANVGGTLDSDGTVSGGAKDFLNGYTFSSIPTISGHGKASYRASYCVILCP